MNTTHSLDQQRLLDWAHAQSRPVLRHERPPIVVRYGATGDISDTTLASLRERVHDDGWVIYSAPGRKPRTVIAQLCAELSLGLADQTLTGPRDGLVELREARSGDSARYQPYSRRALGWHTDGYYNSRARTIRAFVLHCVRPATRGGANAMIDPRRVAAAIYRLNPTLLAALGTPDVMTIPANLEAGKALRAEAKVPVFSIADDGELVMRFTNRSTHIRWRHGALYDEAHAALLTTIEAQSAGAARVVLRSGEGILCNNVLHCREAYDDGEAVPGRSLLRGRYLAPVGGLPNTRATNTYAATK